MHTRWNGPDQMYLWTPQKQIKGYENVYNYKCYLEFTWPYLTLSDLSPQIEVFVSSNARSVMPFGCIRESMTPMRLKVIIGETFKVN